MKNFVAWVVASRWLSWGLRLLVGGAFVYAGASKIGSPQLFADSIASFRLLPNAAVNLLALGLPVFELAVGALLLSGWWLRAAVTGALLLTTVFAAALGSALARGVVVDCGCFGGSHTPTTTSSWFSLGRDVLLGAAAALLLLCQHASQQRPT